MLILTQLSVLGGSLWMKHINSKPDKDVEGGALEIKADTLELLRFSSRYKLLIERSATCGCGLVQMCVCAVSKLSVVLQV